MFVEAPSVVGYLTNESQQVSTSQDGTVISYSGLGGAFKVLQGDSEVPSNKVTYSYTGNNLTLNLDSNTGIFSVTNLAADTGTATITATYTPGGSKVYTVTKVYTLAKSKPGAVGTRGSSFYRLVLRNGVFPTSQQASADMLTYLGVLPVLGDILTYTNSSGSVSSTREYNGSTWVVPAMVIDGSLVATGTIAGDRLIAGTSINAPNIIAGNGTFEGTVYAANLEGDVMDTVVAPPAFNIYLGTDSNHPEETVVEFSVAAQPFDRIITVTGLEIFWVEQGQVWFKSWKNGAIGGWDHTRTQVKLDTQPGIFSATILANESATYKISAYPEYLNYGFTVIGAGPLTISVFKKGSSITII